jgi:hypothetical protein
MARSRYENCFYYFRGPGVREQEADFDRQLEDNTTKALLNVLEHSGPGLTRSFLNTVVGIAVPLDQLPVQYFLQNGPGTPADNRLLLGLSNTGQIEPASWVGRDAGSRVDGAIHVPDRFTVLIETKVVNALDGAQLQRHAERWGLPKAEREHHPPTLPPEWRIRRWADVHAWSRLELSRHPTEPVSFLLGQLIEYLELIGLAPTWTLRDEHFEFFSESPQKRDLAIRPEIRTRLGSIWSAVESEVGPDRFSKVFGEVRVGNLGESADHAWAQTNVEAGSDLPNLTIEINPHELNLNIVGVFDIQAGHVERWLVATGGRALADADYELVAFRRTAARGHHGKVIWRGAKQEVFERVFLRDLKTTIGARLANWRKPLEHQIQRLGFHIRKTWKRPNAVDRADLPRLLADEIEKLIPVMIEIRNA